MAKKMKVFKTEISDGVAEAIKSQASIAYCTQARELVQPTGIVDPKITAFVQKVKAENQNQFDLFYLESVLVSTGWNKNDDVFLPNPTWAARATPEDKQFNFMHDENDIIGHITGSYVLAKDGNRIDSSQAETPEDFDIITQAVLYNSWSDPENKQRMEQIIAEIKEGKWFVSMECLFAGFDYALIDEEKGTAKLLERNEASAFLSKHLRSYGGTGKYENYKIGRALKEISFSGKGLVSKPANPRSVILNNSKSTAAFNVDENDIETTISSIGETQMPDPILEKQIEQLTAQLAAAQNENKTLATDIAKAKDKEVADRIKAFEDQVAEKVATVATLEDAIKATQAKVAELEDALKASQKALEDSQAAFNDMKKKEKMQARKASLSEFLAEDVVTETLAGIGDLPDAAFDSVVAAMKKTAAAKTETTTTKAPVTAATLEGVESTEATLVETTDDETDKAKAEMADWFTKSLNQKKSAKK